jgi:hypothetical protein
MANNFLISGTLAALGWVFINGSSPMMEPMARAPISRVAPAASSMITSRVTASQRPVLEIRRAPVPLVRNVWVSPAHPASGDVPVAATEQQAQDDLDKSTAKAAVELDGYKRASIVSKASNGAWRAKGYRGTTEALLTVDGTGRVSMD